MDDRFAADTHRLFLNEQNPVSVASTLLARMRKELDQVPGHSENEWVQAAARGGSRIQRPTIEEAVNAVDDLDLELETVVQYLYRRADHFRTRVEVGVAVHFNQKGWASVDVRITAPTKALADGLAAVADKHLDKYQTKEGSSGVSKRLALKRKLEEIQEEIDSRPPEPVEPAAPTPAVEPPAARERRSLRERFSPFWQKHGMTILIATGTGLVATVLGGVILALVLGG